MKLGKLKEIKLRDIWKHEQYNFSKWLAKEENISELGDTLGLTLIDIETEKNVGSYSMELRILYRLKLGNRLHRAWWIINLGRRIIW